MSFADLLSATSSPVSECGVTHSGEQDGTTTDQCGRARALANLSARQAKEAGLMMSGTYGRRSTTLSKHSPLVSSLASKLRAKTDSLGSTLYKLTWKERVTPSGRSIYALRASARRISGNDSTGWATPVANDDNKSPEAHLVMKARMGGGRKEITSLQVMAKMATWTTPQAHDATPRGSGQTYEKNGAGNACLARDASLATWATPDARTGRGGVCSSLDDPIRRMERGNAMILESQALLADWRTPSASDGEGGVMEIRPGCAGKYKLMDQAPLTDSGQMLNGSTAETKSGGQLNPAHSRWLMGLPSAWDDCGVTGIALWRRSRKRSSKATWRQPNP